jgi:hypothetical protein
MQTRGAGGDSELVILFGGWEVLLEVVHCLVWFRFLIRCSA